MTGGPAAVNPGRDSAAAAGGPAAVKRPTLAAAAPGPRPGPTLVVAALEVEVVKVPAGPVEWGLRGMVGGNLETVAQRG